MTDIDETTGLPKLPDGYRWRVEKGNAFFIGRELSGYAPSEPDTVSVWAEQQATRIDERHRGLWWGVTRTERTIWVRVQDVNPVKVENPEPADIVKAALEFWGAVERRKRIASLLGVYPPSRLGGVS